MKDVSDKNFGLIIAFLLPGFICLWGLSFSSSDIAAWLAKSSADKAPSVGGFLYATLASVALGLMLSAGRWLIIDHLHHCTGIAQPTLDFSKLSDEKGLAAFQAIVENHYRYYQYYANTFVGIVFAAIAYLVRGPAPSALVGLATMAVLIALYWGSRDCLSKYYQRAASVLGGGGV